MPEMQKDRPVIAKHHEIDFDADPASGAIGHARRA
jgi:hypothetical protein